MIQKIGKKNWEPEVVFNNIIFNFILETYSKHERTNVLCKDISKKIRERYDMIRFHFNDVSFNDSQFLQIFEVSCHEKFFVSHYRTETYFPFHFLC